MTKNNKIPELPDIKKWIPKKKKSITLHDAFLKRCRAVEELILLKSNQEKQMNIENFDSGLGLEDIIRQEFKELLPKRYCTFPGVINDRAGMTAGDFDLIIFNEFWFPKIKSGATKSSRRIHVPIEGVYAVGEIKQTINFKTLDDSMRKLVICHKLNRPYISPSRIVENREFINSKPGLSNPLFSFIIAANIDNNIDFSELIHRFYLINKGLERLNVIRCLSVLGQGTVLWGFYNKNDEDYKPALFMHEDLFEPIIPAYCKSSKIGSAFYPLITSLFSHLFNSVLPGEDIAAHYGPNTHYTSFPSDKEIKLEQDNDLIQNLLKNCKYCNGNNTT